MLASRLGRVIISSGKITGDVQGGQWMEDEEMVNIVLGLEPKVADQRSSSFSSAANRSDNGHMN